MFYYENIYCEAKMDIVRWWVQAREELSLCPVDGSNQKKHSIKKVGMQIIRRTGGPNYNLKNQ